MKIALLFLSVSLLLSSCATQGPRLMNGIAYDVVVKASPYSVKRVEESGAVDAIEPDPEKAKLALHVISFRIDRTLQGEYTMVRKGGSSRYSQAKDALSDKNILKLVTLDFEDPNELEEKKWLSIAVHNSEEEFGLKVWQEPSSEDEFKIYLQKIPEKPGSYYYAGNKKI